MKSWAITIALIFYSGLLSAQLVPDVNDSVKVTFQQGRVVLVPSIGVNRSSLERFAERLNAISADSSYCMREIVFVGGASPEGSVNLNIRLSEKRAHVLSDYISRYVEFPDSLKTTVIAGRDWEGLARMVRNDMSMPFRDETLRLLSKIAGEGGRNVNAGEEHLEQLRALRGGVPYLYMYQHFFPELRAARTYVRYMEKMNRKAPVPDPCAGLMMLSNNTLCEVGNEIAYIDWRNNPGGPAAERGFYMDLRTNMLYDALLMPDIGVEFYLGKGWSVMADWMYGWWRHDSSRWYWRAYGGNLGVRKWFGKEARKKPLTGHHLGVYGQIFTFDFEAGGRGFMGGEPGGALWDKMNYAAGVEYGYSLPVARRLNLDFTIGIGYWGGLYHEYVPVDDCYVWQSTKRRHWFGPTKAEISLVWLIGNGNINRKKGDKR